MLWFYGSSLTEQAGLPTHIQVTIFGVWLSSKVYVCIYYVSNDIFAERVRTYTPRWEIKDPHKQYNIS